MDQLEFSFIPSRSPVLSPDQALRLWELVEALAQAIWQHYESPILKQIQLQNRAAEQEPET